jgi:hypothetical protein
MTKSSTTAVKSLWTLNPTTILACVLPLVAIPLIFPGSAAPEALWLATKTTFGLTNDDDPASLQQQDSLSSSSSSSALPSDMEKRRPLSPMEQKFYISEPQVSWHENSISLEFQMSEWVTVDVIQHKFFEWDCETELESLEEKREGALPLLLARIPEKIVSEMDESTTHGVAVDESDNFPTNIWRLTLDWNPALLSEEQSSLLRVHNPYRVCVRWMLHNLPLTHEYSMGVTFKRAQLSIHYRAPHRTNGSTIERVDVSIPEETKIGINVNGRGRAVVYREL